MFKIEENINLIYFNGVSYTVNTDIQGTIRLVNLNNYSIPISYHKEEGNINQKIDNINLCYINNIGNIINTSINLLNSNIPYNADNGLIQNISSTSDLLGYGATFNIKIENNNVTEIRCINQGYNYQENEKITIKGSDLHSIKVIGSTHDGSKVIFNNQITLTSSITYNNANLVGYNVYGNGIESNTIVTNVNNLVLTVNNFVYVEQSTQLTLLNHNDLIFRLPYNKLLNNIPIFKCDDNNRNIKFNKTDLNLSLEGNSNYNLTVNSETTNISSSNKNINIKVGQSNNGTSSKDSYYKLALEGTNTSSIILKNTSGSIFTTYSAHNLNNGTIIKFTNLPFEMQSESAIQINKEYIIQNCTGAYFQIYEVHITKIKRYENKYLYVETNTDTDTWLPNDIIYLETPLGTLTKNGTGTGHTIISFENSPNPNNTLSGLGKSRLEIGDTGVADFVNTNIFIYRVVDNNSPIQLDTALLEGINPIMNYDLYTYSEGLSLESKQGNIHVMNTEIATLDNAALYINGGLSVAENIVSTGAKIHGPLEIRDKLTYVPEILYKLIPTQVTQVIYNSNNSAHTYSSLSNIDIDNLNTYTQLYTSTYGGDIFNYSGEDGSNLTTALNNILQDSTKDGWAFVIPTGTFKITPTFGTITYRDPNSPDFPPGYVNSNFGGSFGGSFGTSQLFSYEGRNNLIIGGGVNTILEIENDLQSVRDLYIVLGMFSHHNSDDAPDTNKFLSIHNMVIKFVNTRYPGYKTALAAWGQLNVNFYNCVIDLSGNTVNSWTYDNANLPNNINFINCTFFHNTPESLSWELSYSGSNNSVLVDKCVFNFDPRLNEDSRINDKGSNVITTFSSYSQYESLSAGHKNVSSAQQPTSSFIDGSSSFIPMTLDTNQFLKIDLLVESNISAITTQGDPNNNNWTLSYKIQYNTEDNSNTYVFVNNGEIFNGNTDQNSKVTNTFTSITARYIKIVPQTWNNNIALRAIMADPPKLVGGENVDEQGTAKGTRNESGTYTAGQIDLSSDNVLSIININGQMTQNMYFELHDGIYDGQAKKIALHPQFEAYYIDANNPDVTYGVNIDIDHFCDPDGYETTDATLILNRGGQTINLLWLEHRNPFINYPFTQVSETHNKISDFNFYISSYDHNLLASTKDVSVANTFKRYLRYIADNTVEKTYLITNSYNTTGNNDDGVFFTAGSGDFGAFSANTNEWKIHIHPDIHNKIQIVNQETANKYLMPFNILSGVGLGFSNMGKYFILEKAENYYGYYYLTYTYEHIKHYLHYVNILGDNNIDTPADPTNKSYLQFFDSTISTPTETNGKYITTSALWKLTFASGNSRNNADGEIINYPEDGDISLGNWILLDNNFTYLPQ